MRPTADNNPNVDTNTASNADSTAMADATRAVPRRTPGLRSRITLVATAVVAVFLVAGAGIFLLLVRGALLDGVRVAAERDAATLAQRIETGGLTALADDDWDDDETFYQVVSASGTVVAASENVSGMAAVADASNDDPGTIRLDGDSGQRGQGGSDGLDGEFVIETEDADDALVVVGLSTEDVSDTLGDVTPLVAGAVPVLLALLAATTWITAGRALRPVERMRREVDAVTAQRLDRRLDTTGANDEVGRLALTMNRMLDRLDESQKAQRRFVSDASHELKSPLASMRQYAEIARLHPDRVTQEDLADAVLDEGSRLEKIVQGMLLLAHADEHTLGRAPAPVDLDDILLAETSRLRASTSLTIDASRVGPARTLGDSALLAQVVRNLADNAARHTNTTIAFGLTAPDGQGAVILTIDDDGPGIPPAERRRVFERFVRLDAARARDAGGSGLGLAIVQEIVLSHGGTVQVTEAPLGGARFEVHLPQLAD